MQFPRSYSKPSVQGCSGDNPGCPVLNQQSCVDQFGKTDIWIEITSIRLRTGSFRSFSPSHDLRARSKPSLDCSLIKLLSPLPSLVHHRFSSRHQSNLPCRDGQRRACAAKHNWLFGQPVVGPAVIKLQPSATYGVLIRLLGVPVDLHTQRTRHSYPKARLIVTEAIKSIQIGPCKNRKGEQNSSFDQVETSNLWSSRIVCTLAQPGRFQVSGSIRRRSRQTRKDTRLVLDGGAEATKGTTKDLGFCTTAS